MTIAVISMIRDSWGGSEELWYEMAKVALAKGHKVIHVGYETPLKHHKIKELESLGLYRILRPGWIPANASALKKYSYLSLNYLRKKLRSPIKQLFDQQPDIILYNGTCYSIANEKALLKYIQLNKSRINFFIIGHLNNEAIRTINENETARVKFSYKLCKKVFFVSKRNIETAKQQLCFDIQNAEVIKNPVNLSSIELIPFISIHTTIQLACVGNLVTAHKGQDILIETLSKWQNKNWVLNIYGNGYDKKYLQNLTEYLNLKKQIIFHDSVSDIREVWKNNHALILASHMEGMPLAVVEAMLCGRICIVTDVGGNSEWISHEKNGFIAEAPTVRSLLKTIEIAYSVKEQWAGMATEAHKTALNLYDPHAGATLLNRIIAE